MRYLFLSLRIVDRFVPLMEHLNVSEVARSKSGFLTAYRKVKGRGEHLSDYWLTQRDGFIARHMAQVRQKNEPLFYDDGLPTRRHLALIAWAYSPQPGKL